MANNDWQYDAARDIAKDLEERAEKVGATLVIRNETVDVIAGYIRRAVEENKLKIHAKLEI